ncbi:DedA family protein [Bacillus haynesii]|uniref:DedA family protein n=1 Tax=Bacillus haynesii TaxID=1925021 RepID=UPI002280DEB3|nr:VTT domain-containing protein [Bacillus haynesii]MCY8755541.1 VTT domain-containing protein [Bacillus haynesii]
MIQQFFEWVQALGLPGLFLVMFMEGSSLPFPGFIFVFSFGYSLSPGNLNTAFIAIGMSLTYCLSSLIPFYLGMKFEGFLPTKVRKGISKGGSFFNRYGIWSIALSRPFGIGNYISYIAGISKVNLFKYLILTFLGIYPWSFFVIFLGNYFNGNYESLKNAFSLYSNYIYAIGIFFLTIILLYFNKLKKKESSKMRM